ncbi:MAG: tRNA (adenosine(37)-N6)-threonylcarbamoyltransferase complex transferase subunit TsaD [Gemmatimonadaceae bacterium]|nr:tRNA (adenosine(37)-N6)-threonylcarbamoyltransferase complex transferase subunit TsaD [Gemmatimonadaceae bacterium]
MIVLGIESSCDETSAAIVEGDASQATLRSCVILSQDVHRVFGGVVPEIASRAHLASLVPVTQRALADAALTLDDIDAIAVTHAPGLVGALLVGVSFANGLALAHNRPVLGVHHLEGHLFATTLEQADAEPPFTALLVSGGHTLLLDVAAWGEYRLLGSTRDDAAGEAFDKAAKLLGLGYPGGRALEALAATAAPHPLAFSPPMLHGGQRAGDADYLDVSFSGLKTAVLREVRAREADGTIDVMRAPIAAAFQSALIETLVAKTLRAAALHHRTRIVLGGGVACNQALQGAMRRAGASRGITVFAPSPRFATDNAAMIARAGLFRLARGERSTHALSAFASLPLPGLVE